jgi:hypothetical protein
MSTKKITGLGTPTADADASTKKYVDDSISALGSSAASSYLTHDGLTPLTGAWSAGQDITATGLTSSGTLSVTGNTTVGGTLGVTGASTLTGNTSVGGTLGVTGATSLSSVSTSGNASVGGTFGVTGNTTLSGTTTLTGLNTANGIVRTNGSGVLSSSVLTGTDVATALGYTPLKNDGNTPSVQTGNDTSKPAAGTPGRLYIAPDAGKIYSDNGTAWTMVAGTGGGGTITGVTAGTGLTGGGTSGGVTLNVDVGTAANKVVQMDATAKLPAVNASQLTNLDAGALTTGTTAVARGGTGLGTTPANGQLLIGNGAGYALATLTGTANEIDVNNAAGSITLSLPATLSGVTTLQNGTGSISVPASGAITIPATIDTLVGRATADTLSNKFLVDNSVGLVDSSDNTIGIRFDAAGSTGTLTTLLGSQTANRILTLPDASGTLATSTYVDTKVASDALPKANPAFTGVISGPEAQLTSDAAGRIPLSIKAISGQTADLIQFKDGGTTVLARVTAGGALEATGLKVGALNGVLKATTGSVTSGPVTTSEGGTGVTAVPANGQVLIGNGTGYTLSTITGTPNQVTVNNTAGTITLGGPQNLASTSSPTFAALQLGSGDLSFNGAAGRKISINQATAGAGADLLIEGGSAAAGVTDSAGGTVHVRGGASNGSQASAVQFETSLAGTSGTTQNAASPRMALVGDRLALGTNLLAPQAQLHIKANSTGTPSARVQAIASQTADLLQFMNPAGNTVLARFDASGGLETPTLKVGSATGVLKATGGTVSIGALAGTDITGALGFMPVQSVSGSTPSIETGLDASKPAVGTAGRLYIANDTGKMYSDSGTSWKQMALPVADPVFTGVMAGRELDLNSASSASVPLLINGAAGQSADHLQIKNSSNSILFAVNSYGDIKFPGDTAYTEIGGTRNPAGSAINGGNLKIMGDGAALGATNLGGGDIQLISGTSTGTGGAEIEFQTTKPGNSGTADNLASRAMVLDGYGNLLLYKGLATGSAQFHVKANGPSPVTAMVDGAAGQTGDLLQLRSATGSVFARFGDIGGLELKRTPGGTTGADSSLYINPLSAGANNLLIAAALNGGAEVFKVDAEGDVAANSINLSGTTGSNVGHDCTWAVLSQAVSASPWTAVGTCPANSFVTSLTCGVSTGSVRIQNILKADGTTPPSNGNSVTLFNRFSCGGSATSTVTARALCCKY